MSWKYWNVSEHAKIYWKYVLECFKIVFWIVVKSWKKVEKNWKKVKNVEKKVEKKLKLKKCF